MPSLNAILVWKYCLSYLPKLDTLPIYSRTYAVISYGVIYVVTFRIQQKVTPTPVKAAPEKISLTLYLLTSLRELPKAVLSWSMTASHNALSALPHFWMSKDANSCSATDAYSAQRENTHEKQVLDFKVMGGRSGWGVGGGGVNLIRVINFHINTVWCEFSD